VHCVQTVTASACVYLHFRHLHHAPLIAIADHAWVPIQIFMLPTKKTCHYPRDIMLWPGVSVSVCLSLRHKSEFYWNGWTDLPFFGMDASYRIYVSPITPIQLHWYTILYGNSFLPRDAVHSRYYSHGPVSVCLCLSQVGVLLKRLNVESHKQHHTIAQGTLVFWCQRSPRNSTGVTPYEGAKCRCGGLKSALSTNNRLSLYLENGTR